MTCTLFCHAYLTCNQPRGFGWRMHCGAEVTESSANQQHTIDSTYAEKKKENMYVRTRRLPAAFVELFGHALQVLLQTVIQLSKGQSPVVCVVCVCVCWLSDSLCSPSFGYVRAVQVDSRTHAHAHTYTHLPSWQHKGSNCSSKGSHCIAARDLIVLFYQTFFEGSNCMVLRKVECYILVQGFHARLHSIHGCRRTLPSLLLKDRA
jgi:hypothetical protein